MEKGCLGDRAVEVILQAVTISDRAMLLAKSSHGPDRLSQPYESRATTQCDRDLKEFLRAQGSIT